MKAVIRHLRVAAMCGKDDGPTDGQLLEYFVVRRDEAAFEALVRRHGSMVLGVCQRLLRSVHDAEDAFQATFLVLARKAALVKPREFVGNWLYGVAYRTALKARTMNAKRRTKEMQAGEIPRAESSTDEELLARLDHELNRLPDKYRVPVVLCELEGRSRKEVARLLAIPEGTLSWRLAHAKKLLGRRLSRYGAVAVSALLADSAASACLSPLLRTSTTKAVLAAGAVSANVLALTEGVMKAMLLSKLKITVCMAALTLVAGVGTTGLTYRAAAQQPQEDAALASRAQADELEALRLEIEALRKSLNATRERVKSLEDEVRTLKTVERNAPKRMLAGGMPGMMPPGRRGGMAPGSPHRVPPETHPAQSTAPGPQPGAPVPPPTQEIVPPPAPPEPLPASEIDPPPAAREPLPPSVTNPPLSTTYLRQPSDLISKPPEHPLPHAEEALRLRDGAAIPERIQHEHPLRHAEEALRRLRENPEDTKAVEALERALKELKQLKEREKSRRPDQPGRNNLSQ